MPNVPTPVPASLRRPHKRRMRVPSSCGNARASAPNADSPNGIAALGRGRQRRRSRHGAQSTRRRRQSGQTTTGERAPTRRSKASARRRRRPTVSRPPPRSLEHSVRRARRCWRVHVADGHEDRVPLVAPRAHPHEPAAKDARDDGDAHDLRVVLDQSGGGSARGVQRGRECTAMFASRDGRDDHAEGLGP